MPARGAFPGERAAIESKRPRSPNLHRAIRQPRIKAIHRLEVFEMKTSPFLALASAAFLCASLAAQQTDPGDSQKTTYAPAAASFGDEAASRSWEMTSVSAELDGKLDSKTAKVGDRVTLKTTGKVQTSDGTVIPRGSHIVGHITQVQSHNNDRAIAQIGIAFDHVELKNGESIPVHSLIRTVRQSGSVSMLNSMDNDDMMSASSMGGGRMGGAGIGTGGSGVHGGSGMPGGSGSLGPNGPVDAGAANTNVGGPVDRAGTMAGTGTGVDANSNIGAGAGMGNVGAAAGANQDSAVQLAGHGDAPITGGAHAAAAARTVPRETGIPGIMLAGSSTSSGLLIDADRRDLEFAGGTRFEMGVVADQ
jgi:hypothetical protein